MSDQPDQPDSAQQDFINSLLQQIADAAVKLANKDATIHDLTRRLNAATRSEAQS